MGRTLMPDLLARLRSRPHSITPHRWRPKVVPIVSRARAVADYLHGEGRDASPAEHRNVIQDRWPNLTPDELRAALDLLWEQRATAADEGLA